MLSEKSTDVVRATLPAVDAAIGDITPIFYQRMFAAHPELQKDLFTAETRHRAISRWR